MIVNKNAIALVIVFFVMVSLAQTALAETHRIEFVSAGDRPTESPSGELRLWYANTPVMRPAVITICVGDSVEFVNNWGGQVNIFSYSSVFRFDLGRFRQGESRTAGPFPKPGLVRIYDEIHSNIKGLINVVDCSEENRPRSIEDGTKRLWEMLGKDDREYFERVERAGQGANKKPDGTNPADQKRSDFPINPTGKPVAIYTSDWQPGDEVSFSFSGILSGPGGGNQTQNEFTGDVVGIVDSQGNKTEIPWSKLIRYKVPQLATSVTASLMKTDRTIISTAKIPVNPKGTKLPIQLPPKISGNTVAYPVHQIGQPYTIYSPAGRFSGDANKIRLAATDKINNTTHVSNAVAASPRSAMFSQQIREPGSYTYNVSDDGKFEESFDVNGVGIKLDTSRAYRVNQQGTLAVIVSLPPRADAQQKLVSENFHVTIKMDTPRVLAFSNGQEEVVWPLQRSEAVNNQARKEFPVRAGTPGTFTITARAKTPQCSNPSMSKVTGIFARAVVSQGLDGIEIRFPDGTRVVNTNRREVAYGLNGKPTETRNDGKDLPPTHPDGTPRDTWQPPLDDPFWLEFVDTVAKVAWEQVKIDDDIAEMYRDAAKEARKNGDEEEARLHAAKAKEAEAAAEADRIRAAREQRRADAVRKRQNSK